MEFRQIEAFCAIVEWGSFSEAAKHLYISQPTISSHLQKLEDHLGKPLLLRTTKTLRLTEDGRRFYQNAKQLLLLRNKTLLNLREDTKLHLQIGASSIPSSCILPALLTGFYEAHPDVTYHITQSGSTQIINRLINQSLDIGFIGTPLYHEQFFCETIARDEMVLVAPVTPQFTGVPRNPDPLRLLTTAPFIVRENGSGTKRETQGILTQLGLSYDDLMIVAEMNDLEALKQSVIHGLGISLLPRQVVEEADTAGQLRILPLSEEGFFREYYMVYSKTHGRQPVLSSLVEFVRKAKGLSH
ncbi:MAG: selenium metabolism-associated LysR family transcriptional regulator [Lachnospiraceae bacterium]|nr:selenium metabolism-associated LysR family transcriptional regulator [Lachnospiraceae bacterium]MDY5741910.1 selenium metabolism-associated LysR family transcriptional regulator [Lachnospiraceae bacterium]